ncbi:MAG: hypothetical protein PHE10_10250, partial [Kiritimatiellae bacterium]|nr:hypothetical protein [Kiritimatiellia bacterium]
GETAVHSDMLEWHAGDTPEHAAKPILASLFSTIQYSMVLSRLPESHLRMMKHWNGFTQRHRETLLKGRFTARHPEANYQSLAAESEDERVIGVYTENTVAGVPDAKDTVVVNATGCPGLLLELAGSRRLTVRDTFGVKVAERAAGPGIMRVEVPVSGYVEVR